MAGVLFLAHRVPYPPNRGDKIRSYHVLRYLAERARVHLVAFADDAADQGHEAVLASLVASHTIVDRTKGRAQATLEALLTGKPASITAFASKAVTRTVDHIVATNEVETIFVYSGQMAQFVPRRFSGRVVMDFVDMDSAKFAGYAETAGQPMRWLLRREARTLGAFERLVAARAEACLFVSDAEAALFRAFGGQNAVTIENGIDTVMFDPGAAFDKIDRPEPLIVFTGQMDYRPNIDAVDDFARNVLPIIQSSVPSIRFAIVGRKPDRRVVALGSLPGVVVTGAVADVRGWLAAADVVVAPLRLARGVQNKVLEAMAMARPVVASPAAAQGIDHRDTILIAATAAESAEKISGLISDSARGDALGARARVQVIERYGWQSRLAALDQIIRLDCAPTQRRGA